MTTKAHENIDSDYVPISTKTGSIYVREGKVSLTIQTSQPNYDAPVMSVLRVGDDKVVKVASGATLYAKSADLTQASITYTEA